MPSFLFNITRVTDSNRQLDTYQRYVTGETAVEAMAILATQLSNSKINATKIEHVQPGPTLPEKDISYCCSNSETIALTQQIRDWIAGRVAEGWTVAFSVHHDTDGRTGVKWQCISNPAHPYQEFTPCISMTGREMLMN